MMIATLKSQFLSLSPSLSLTLLLSNPPLHLPFFLLSFPLFPPIGATDEVLHHIARNGYESNPAAKFVIQKRW